MARPAAPRGARTVTRTLAAAVLLGVPLAACGGLQLTNDHRLTFSEPADRSTVKAPVTVSWSMTGFTATGLDGGSDVAAGAYAVFVDRPPIKVGQTLKSLGDGDPSCERDPRCPDAAYLAAKHVYVTTESTVTIDTLPPADKGVGKEDHTVTVVLLDGTGHRRTESAWYRDLRSVRRG